MQASLSSLRSSTEARRTLALRSFIVVMVLMVAAALLTGLVGQLRAIERSAAITVDKDVRHVERVLTEKTADALALATLIAQDPTIVRPLAHQQRRSLLERFEEPFEVLRRDHGVNHLHFAVPPATSLLRVHVPNTYGDDLTHYRPMLVAAMASGVPLAGFERGRFGASARAVVPVRASIAPDSWMETGDDVPAVVGVVDLGFSLDTALLSDALSESAVALITLPSQAVAETLDRDDPIVVQSTFDETIDLAVADPAAAHALIDGDLTELIPHDHRQWRLSRRVLPDHLGEPAAVLLVASDVSDARHATLLAHLTTVLTLLLLLAVGAVLEVLRRRGLRTVQAATESVVRSAQLSRALRLADTEDATLRVADRALSLIGDGAPTRLLLADSSRAHFEVAVNHGFGPAATGAEQSGAPDPGQQLPTPGRCPATRSGEIQRFEDPTALDACPFILSGECGTGEGVHGVLRCRPLSVQGATVGVLQVQPHVGALDRHLEHRLDDLVRQIGDHLSTVRAQAESSRQAGTDPLTGVSNRRSFDAAVTGRLRERRPYAVLFADLDHFKLLNDTHGHEVGDRALRLFAGTMKASFRPDDLVARFGGEEFVVYLPDCDREQARVAAERLRGDLALALTAGGVPGFTVSIGVADYRHVANSFEGPGFDQVLRAADTALLQAKEFGRNRVTICDERVLASPVDGLVSAGGVPDDPRDAAEASGRATTTPTEPARRRTPGHSSSGSDHGSVGRSASTPASLDRSRGS